MIEYQIPYGKSSLKFKVPDNVQSELILPIDIKGVSDPIKEIIHALSHPIGKVTLDDFRGVNSVAIAVNDKTRPVPNEKVLLPLLDRLISLGIPKKAIRFFIATGSHPLVSKDEFNQFLPEKLLEEYKVVCHDCHDHRNLIYLGETSRGTPVWINKDYYNSDLRIGTGLIEPHQFQGFSGGVKSVAVGLAGWETINRNHALMVEKKAQLSLYKENPARQDVEDIGRLCDVHFVLNLIINGRREIVYALAGDPIEVMRKGIPLSQEINQVKVNEPYDIVIASPGGYPKDINLYQSQKSLAHASLITRKGGTVILVAACSEGTGSRSYEAFVTGMKSHEEVVVRFKQEGFRLGAHKAFQIARDAQKVHILLLSMMPKEKVIKLLLTPVKSISEALAMTIGEDNKDLRLAIMPHASSTIPLLKK